VDVATRAFVRGALVVGGQSCLAASGKPYEHVADSQATVDRSAFSAAITMDPSTDGSVAERCNLGDRLPDLEGPDAAPTASRRCRTSQIAGEQET